ARAAQAEDWIAYKAMIKRRIKSQWFPAEIPRVSEVRNAQKHDRLEFTIKPNGAVSVSVKDLDTPEWKTIMRASPFGKTPDGKPVTGVCFFRVRHVNFPSSSTSIRGPSSTSIRTPSRGSWERPPVIEFKLVELDKKFDRYFQLNDFARATLVADK